MEKAIGIKDLLIQLITLIIAFRNRRTFEENLLVFSNLDLYPFDRTANRTNCVRFVFMIAGNCSKTLCQSIADNHIDTDGMDKFLHFGTYCGTGRGKDVRMFETQLFTHQTQHRLVVQTVAKRQGKWRAPSMTQVVYVVLTANTEGMIEKTLLHTSRMVDTVFHCNIDFLPEARHCRHTGGMSLTHRLLNLTRIGVDNKLRPLGECQVGPSALEDMRERQEADYPIALTHRDTLVISHKGRGILPIRKHHTLAFSRGAAGV